MIKIITLFLSIIIVGACGLDPLQTLRGPVSIGISRIVREDCTAKIGSSHLGYEKCLKVSQCVELKARNKANFDNYSYEIWKIIDKIRPPVLSEKRPDRVFLEMSQMRLNANQAGPSAVELFNIIKTIRGQCLIETDLR